MGTFITRCLRNLLMAATVLTAWAAALAQAPTYQLGRAPTSEEIKNWDIAVGPSGKELPPGSATAKEGAKVFAQRCAGCHGTDGEGKLAKRLVGGRETLTTLRPLKTTGSFWPFATSIWDTINRGMPYDKPGSLSADEVYAVTAFLLYKSGIIQETDVMDAKTLPKVKMPNRDNFIPQRVEDIPKVRCRLGTCP